MNGTCIAPRIVRLAFAAVTGFLLAACESGPSPVAPESALLSRSSQAGASAAMNRQLAAVRAATARFHRVEVALEEGYVSTVECAALPGVGAMGVHFIKPSLMGDAGFDPLQPEVLVYEPQKNGKFKLVAVEYLIFRAPWEAAGKTGRPMFGDVPFVQSFGDEAHGLPDHYELHVWLWRHNPEGMFAQWNPMVTCPTSTSH